MKTLQLELAAEYLLMAATLTAIKARMLIPSNEDKEDEESLRQLKILDQKYTIWIFERLGSKE